MKLTLLMMFMFLFSCKSEIDQCSEMRSLFNKWYNDDAVVTMCHKVSKGHDGNVTQWVEITVPVEVVSSHIFHGDHITTGTCCCTDSMKQFNYAGY